LAEFRDWTESVNSNLLERAEREARSGAKIVFWAEENAIVLSENEAALIERGRQLARRQEIYLGMALATWTPGRPLPRQNKLVMIEPSGEVAWEYLKTHPVPGGKSLSQPGDGTLRTLDTPYGRLSAVICFDADFPRLLAQAGAMGTDILLVPAADLRAMDPLHTHMASFRAVEQGVNLIRQTSEGRSAVYDYQGGLLATMDHFQASDHVMIAQVPTAGTRTFYSRTGDWFAWLSLASFAALAVAAQAGRRTHPSSGRL
jgi:apolipoprotein N-acyltransferase